MRDDFRPARAQGHEAADGRVVSPRGADEIEGHAAGVRKLLGVTAQDRVSMIPLLEFVIPQLLPSYEFRVVEDDVLGQVEAITDLRDPIIQFSNRSYQKLREADPRARFTAAHELGHLLLHTARPVHYARGVVQRRMDPEWQADTFAAAFLMPKEAFQRSTSLDHAVSVFGVSYRAAIWRAERLNMNHLVPQNKNGRR